MELVDHETTYTHISICSRAHSFSLDCYFVRQNWRCLLCHLPCTRNTYIHWHTDTHKQTNISYCSTFNCDVCTVNCCCCCCELCASMCAMYVLVFSSYLFVAWRLCILFLIFFLIKFCLSLYSHLGQFK